ncbi:MAG: flagellar hook capping FlgD N-terminal domain-containing protein [Verrucomicrobiota bacterium]|jgi:flagellar basal-body rod modification protein FlgD
MSSTSSIASSYAAATSGATSPDTVSGGAQQTLTQNDFLQLLVAQMENQDPMDPQSDTDMAAQMAQFTSLTQTTAMSSSLSALQANSLIGSTVTVSTDSKGDTTSGVVQSVNLGSESSDGTPQIVINGTAYDLSQVLSVTPVVNTTNPTTTPTSSSN